MAGVRDEKPFRDKAVTVLAAWRIGLTKPEDVKIGEVQFSAEQRKPRFRWFRWICRARRGKCGRRARP